MLDINATDGSVRKKPYKSPIPGTALEAVEVITKAKLDSDKYVALHRRLMDLYVRELERQYENRMEMATDADFYDNIQWREEDAAVLKERGQVPLVYNVVAGTVNWVTGTEKRGRSDYKILPRRKEDSKPAERKTQLLKYLSDVNKTPFSRSAAFEDAVKVGMGWLEDGIQDDADGEPLYSRHESWRNILWDSAASEMDLSDARFMCRAKWSDLDIAKAMFPKRGGLINMSVNVEESGLGLDPYGDPAMDSRQLEMAYSGTASSATWGFERRVVRLIEMWFRAPAMIERMKGGLFSGEIYDPYSAAHIEAVEGGDSEVVTRPGLRMFVSIMTPRGMLYCGPSPYRHNRYPFTPIWGNRRDRDGMPYGMIRGLRDIQEDINKRASKALHILSTNKVIMDEGAVDDVDELLEEVARPDALIVKKKGFELDINNERELSGAHMDFMSRDIAMIQQASGVTDELMGRTTNAKSGIAIQRRQEQGSLATTKYFDNLRYAMQAQGEKQLSLIEQFMSDQKAFRITNMRGTPEYIKVNDGLPENDIIRSKADFVISDADWRATMRQAAADELLEAMTRMPPEVALVMLDLVVENMDLPNRDELVRRIRSVTGQRDPDADPNETTPEEQAKAAAQAEQMQMQRAAAMASIRKMIAEALRAERQAAAAQAQAVNTNVKSLGGPKRGAIDIAAELAVMPAEIAHVADGLAHEMGLVGRSEDEAALADAQRQAAGGAQPTGQPPAPIPPNASQNPPAPIPPQQ